MSAVKLASGYIELTVKKAGDAMKEITSEITNVGKHAEKVGKEAGDALSKGISDGLKKASTKTGASMAEEIILGDGRSNSQATKTATKVGTDAGKAAGKAINDGISQGAKDAGKTIQDEITKATKKAGDDVGKTKIEPQVLPKVDTSSARGSIIKDVGGAILDAARQGAKDAGTDLDKWAVDQAGKVGGALGKGLHDILPQGVQEVIDSATEGFGKLRDAITGVRAGDATTALKGLAGALHAVGQEDASGAVSGFAKELGPVAASVSELNGLLDGLIGKSLNARSALGLVGGAYALSQLNSGLQSGDSDKARASALGTIASGAAIGSSFGPVGTAAGTVAGGAAALGTTVYDAFKNEPKTNEFLPDNHGAPGVPFSPLGPPPAAAPGSPTTPSGPKALKSLLGFADGGVTPEGVIFGPGTGTSDSILGVDANGVPTARVSTGEGIVKKSAMDSGGANIVAALNAGQKLPGYDDGTTNVGGAPVPLPAIQVQPATTGQAGRINDWLSSIQGHPYQYGTLYDCSGFMSQVYNHLTGKQMPRFNTESDLAAYGFVRGSKPGTFNLGIHHGGGGPNSHMAGTLPDGRAIESADNGVQIGAGAHGANDKQFEDHWYLPGSEGVGAPAALVGQGDAPNLGLPGVGQAPPSADRTQGYIPAGAGGHGTAGSSFLSGAYQMGAQAINGLIDQAASAASTAVAAGVAAGSFGAGAVGGSQAGAALAASAIGLGTNAAKRGVTYGAQMLGIGTDALAEILLPFGVPRLFQTDPTQFMPQLPNQAAATTTGEKAEGQQSGVLPQEPNMSPSGPVQPMQLPGQQPVGSPAKPAQGGGVASAPVPINGLLPGAPATPTGGSGPMPVPTAPPPSVAQQQITTGPPPTPVPSAAPPVTDLGTYLQSLAGVYDDGGWLQPGGIAINQSNRPEPILNDQQWGNLQQIAGQPAPRPDPKAAGGSNDYSLNFHEGSITVKDVDELSKELSSRQRLGASRGVV